MKAHIFFGIPLFIMVPASIFTIADWSGFFFGQFAWILVPLFIVWASGAFAHFLDKPMYP